MFRPLFAQAALSPSRQRTFRGLVVAHLLLLIGGTWIVDAVRPGGLPMLGHALLIAGMVEGALLIGWRLTQLPKSPALEFLFVSPVRPWWLFLGEASVGAARLALITLAGLPPLLLLVLEGTVAPNDLVLLLGLPFTWGVLAGLSLIAWAYEPRRTRRWGERVMLALIVLYLLVGVLAGEHLKDWLDYLVPASSAFLMTGFEALHRNSPFAVMQTALQTSLDATWARLVSIQLIALVVIVVLLLRTASRLKKHFDELHYRPAVDESGRIREPIGANPLAWWAVKRVSEYTGQVNLWLAGGFAILYALYTLAGTSWPPWLGRQVFEMFDRMGGIPVVTTALIVLSAVPAAFQYGLWDSNAHDRCRRLELLLLTRLGARDYWEASAAAAWRRGEGYFALAVLLWTVYAFRGPVALPYLLLAAAAGVVLWGLYFAVGFQAFVRGAQANNLGLLLSVGFPVLTIVCGQMGVAELAALTPPGAVYGPGSGHATSFWLPGLLVSGLATLALGYSARLHCERDLRRWYDNHHGVRAIE
jgi:hypothetical protein